MNCPRCGSRLSVARFDGRCPDCGNDYLQPFAIRCLRQWKFTSWPDGRCGRVPREGPTEGFYTDGKRGPYLFACKRTLYENVYASFSKTLIGAALTATPRRTLALFVGPGPYAIDDVWAFDARRVANQADERQRNHVDSKRERNVPIFDVSPREHGCPLGDYLSGRKRLPGPAVGGTHHTTLRQFELGVRV